LKEVVKLTRNYQLKLETQKVIHNQELRSRQVTMQNLYSTWKHI